MVLMPGFQSTRLVTEGALEPFFFLYTDDSIQGNPETCKQSSIMLNYEVKNTYIEKIGTPIRQYEKRDYYNNTGVPIQDLSDFRVKNCLKCKFQSIGASIPELAVHLF